MSVVVKTTLLLVCSNVFMTFAWYAHLKNLKAKPRLIAVAASWGIALLRVPAAGAGQPHRLPALSLAQLKILQEVITLPVFMPFAVLYMRQPLKLGLCLGGALPARGRLLHLPLVGARLTAALTIRDLQPSERAALGRLMVEVYAGLDGFPTPADQPKYYEMLADIGSFADKPSTRVLVAISTEGALVGGVVYFGDMAQYGSGGTATTVKDASGIRLLGVAPKFRNTGRARR